MNIIEIENLTYSYPASKIPILKNISLQIEKGDFLAVVGNNGCGKSTFCKTLNGLIPHFITGDFEGKVKVDGINTLESDVGILASKAGYVYQDFENQIVRPTVLDDASYACLNYTMPDYLERGRKALSLCGLENRENDYIWQLSGGQTHLLALAGAVSLSPDILILDEPIAQLDPKHADKIYQVLRQLNEQYGKTIIVIEHHTEYIADYCKHVMLMKDGTIAWKLPTKEALQRVEELQECNIFPPQVTIAAYHMKQSNRLPTETFLPTTISEGKEMFCHLRYHSPENITTASHIDADTIVKFQNVSVAYRSVKGEDRIIFDNLNLEIRKGEKIALIGSNGAGKSTLMKLMVGLLKPNNGDIFLKGESIRKKKTENLSETISLVYQNPEEMFIKDSIEADISYAMKVRNFDHYSERTQELLSRFRLTELKDRDGRLLSGGQMRRASLAIGIALNPEILLLDEPTANLDIATRKEIMRTLTDLKDITETVIIATHDMQLVCEWADRIIVLCQGKVLADGSRDDIFGNKTIIETVGIRPPEIFSMGQVLDPAALCYTIDEFEHRFQEVPSGK
jgi:energy-coupling factor transporter ATP-binding protein EcfA2